MIYRDLTREEQHALMTAILQLPPDATLDRLYDLTATDQLRVLVDIDAELANQWSDQENT